MTRMYQEKHEFVFQKKEGLHRTSFSTKHAMCWVIFTMKNHLYLLDVYDQYRLSAYRVYYICNNKYMK